MTNKRPLLARAGLSATFVAMLFAGSSLATGQSEFLVYSFPKTGHSIAAGCTPQGNLVADSAGNLYGTTKYCGVGVGTVFKLARPVPPSKQWIETVIHDFTGGSSGSLDGRYPQGGVVFDAAGNLYGTAVGGANGLGVIFELSPPATEGDEWTESLLYSFKGGVTDGAFTNGPLGTEYPGSEGVVFDGSGNLYGVTPIGGSSIQEYGYCLYGCGVLYKLTPPTTSGGSWTETVLHSFKAKQGAVYPVGTPIFDGKGNLYGATEGGSGNGHDLGAAAYRLSPPATEGGAWIYRVLYTFSPFSGMGYGPQSSLTFHNSGRLYGTTEFAGPYVGGTVFELVPPAVAGGEWTQNVLYNFGNGTDGAYPLANVTFDKAGNLYGTTWIGGTGTTSSSCYYRGCGTVFKLSPPASEGGDWTETILHSFGPPSTTDGSEPMIGFIVWKNGVLFGVTPTGGRGGEGTVFGVVP